MIPPKILLFHVFRDAICNFVICNDSSLRSQPIIFNPDFFVEKLRHEKPEVFTELVVSNITRLIDLPGTELAQLMGEVDLKLPGGAGPASGFFRSLMSLKRKGRRCICEGGRSQLLPGLHSEHLHVHGGVSIIIKHFLSFFIYMSSKTLSNINKNYKNCLDKLKHIYQSPRHNMISLGSYQGHLDFHALLILS